MGEIVLVGQSQIVKELAKMKSQIDAALPRHITPDRMARIALTALRKTPKLYECTLESFFGSIITASQLGLEPGVNGQCYLIPYKKECTFIPGWRGYMDLVSRTARASAETHAVYDGDEFDYEYGTRAAIHHKPGKWHGEKNALTFVYAMGRVKGMEEWPIFEVWDIDRIWQHRDKNNKCYDKKDHYSFAHPEMYARKIPLLQIIKYLPSSIEINAASMLDIAGTEGRQRITIEGALSKNFEGGEQVEKSLEIERLMSVLNWPEDKREMARDGYAGREDELLATLQREAVPIEGAQSGKAKAATGSAKKSAKAESKPQEKPEPESKPDPEPQTQDSEPQTEADPEPASKPQPTQEAGQPKRFLF